jgi:hypothetical protein
MYNEILQELQREREAKALLMGVRKQNSELHRDKQRNYFSHTRFGKKYRERAFPHLRACIEQSVLGILDNPNQASTNRAERNAMIAPFLDAIKHLKSRARVNTFDRDAALSDLYDLLSHITLTAMLDNAATPYIGALNSKGKLRNPSSRNKRTLDELEVDLGDECYFQLRMYLLSLLLKGWTEGVSKYASHKGLANLHYHHYNCDRMIKKLKAEALTAFGKVDSIEDPEERAKIRQQKFVVDALNIFDHGWAEYKGNKFLGQWMLSVALTDANLNAFTIKKDFIPATKRDQTGKVKRRSGTVMVESKLCQFLEISEEYKEKWKFIYDEQDIDNLNQHDREQVVVRIPMLIPPKPLSNESKGGWLGDASPLLESFKGSTELSQTHIDFFNRQMEAAFKINPWMLKLLQTLFNPDPNHPTEPIKLGSFKVHHVQKPMRTSMRLMGQYKITPGWDELTSDEQKQLIIEQVGRDAWNKARVETNQEWENQYDLKRKGSASTEALSVAQMLSKDERFYFPVRPDFRNRVVVRTAHVHYQGTDHGKALIKFADSVPKDDETERWLLINMANHYGGKLDKESFQTRVNTMAKKVAEITAVAKMLDDDGSFKAGLDILKQVDFQGGKCFQFAATCREYWELYIAKTKDTTDLIVTVDCSTSGQQIASVWLRNSELAMKTNVKNNGLGKPSDLYGAVFTMMLYLMAQDKKKFIKETQDKLMDLGFGRAICKAAIQGAQYGSGTKTQVTAIREKIADIEAKGQVYFIKREEGDADTIIDEVELFCTYFPLALEQVCQLSTLNKWFKLLAETVQEVGHDEILIPTPIGSISHIQYKPLKKRRIRTFNYGETKAGRMTQISEVNEDPDEQDRKDQLEAWKSGTCPNSTHSYDACLIAMALHDFPYPFTSCHDSLGCHASSRMDDLRKALQKALLEIANYDVFGEILRINGVEKLLGKPPVHKNWSDMEHDILNSEYFTG